jgi:hypothetical protein
MPAMSETSSSKSNEPLSARRAVALSLAWILGTVTGVIGAAYLLEWLTETGSTEQLVAVSMVPIVAVISAGLIYRSWLFSGWVLLWLGVLQVMTVIRWVLWLVAWAISS